MFNLHQPFNVSILRCNEPRLIWPAKGDTPNEMGVQQNNSSRLPTCGGRKKSRSKQLENLSVTLPSTCVPPLSLHTNLNPPWPGIADSIRPNFRAHRSGTPHCHAYSRSRVAPSPARHDGSSSDPQPSVSLSNLNGGSSPTPHPTPASGSPGI
ncbi:hypothetical protein LZ30DRAFT_460581 [Colletotrichum cereale]|nr:hypothetical protein LZ30DRAFT_460581 [Colletotrichum cereale]